MVFSCRMADRTEGHRPLASKTRLTSTGSFPHCLESVQSRSTNSSCVTVISSRSAMRSRRNASFTSRTAFVRSWSVYFASLAAFFSKRGAERGDLERYFTYLVIGVFILFTPLKTKLPHYIFPALPFLAAVLAVYWSRSRRPRRALVVPAAAMAGATLVLMLAAAPRLAPSFPAFYLARESRNFLKPEMDFATVGFNEPSLVWYLRRYVHGKHIAMSENDVRAFMAIKSPRICVLPAETSYKLVSFDAGLKILYAKGINPAKGDWVELVMLVRPD